MKKYFILSIVSLLAMASCTVQEILIQEADSVEFQDVYHAGFGDAATKTAVDSQGLFYWDNGDMISVFRSTANQSYVYEGESGARLADFVRADDSFYAGQDIPATIAVYPYSEAYSVTEDGSGVLVDFPYYQYYADGSFGRDAAPLVAVTKDINDRDLYFKNLAGFLVIPAFGDVTVKKVEFHLNSGDICYSYRVNPVYGEDPVLTENERNNYPYVYSKKGMKNAADELRAISEATINDIDVLNGILSKYVMGGRTKAALWNAGVKDGIFLKLLEKYKELLEYWDGTTIREY